LLQFFLGTSSTLSGVALASATAIDPTGSFSGTAQADAGVAVATAIATDSAIIETASAGVATATVTAIDPTGTLVGGLTGAKVGRLTVEPTRLGDLETEPARLGTLEAEPLATQLLYENDNNIVIKNYRTASDGTAVEDASMTFTLYDIGGDVVNDASAVSMSHEGGGTYRGLLPESAGLTNGTKYRVEVDVSNYSDKWEGEFTVKKRGTS